MCGIIAVLRRQSRRAAPDSERVRALLAAAELQLKSAPTSTALVAAADALAELDLLEPIVGGLSDAQLVRITEADHGFAVLKRSGRDPEDVLDEVADAAARACGASGASRN